MSNGHELRFAIENVSLVEMLGAEDKLLRMLEKEFPEVEIMFRGNECLITGDEQTAIGLKNLLSELSILVRSGSSLQGRELQEAVKLAKTGAENPTSFLSGVIISPSGKRIRPKTPGQGDYVRAIEENTVIFGLGPAGTGKTYLAVAKAVQALQQKQISRIILTRPAVEAGERLGFLPGSLSDKIDPYLRPLFDALQEMLPPEATSKFIESGVVEVAPLAYMRGRTLNDSFVILDEAQNTTPEQLKMFLTRLGFGSKMVITGDTSQVDLPNGKSGLLGATKILADIEQIHIAKLTASDVVRHELVTKMVNAYEAHGK